MLEGFFIGDKCNRNGCEGIIAEREIDGCCSCHLRPPCGYCTTPREHCPVCDWVGELKSGSMNGFVTKYDPKTDVIRAWKRRELDPSKIDYHVYSHTNSSQRCEGVYPDGTTKAQILERVKGTFGGRFTHFGNGKFEYIAYTD